LYFCNIAGMSQLPDENWPEEHLRRLRIKEVVVCGRLLHPPLYS
jgi:hypothetical protein